MVLSVGAPNMLYEGENIMSWIVVDTVSSFVFGDTYPEKKAN